MQSITELKAKGMQIAEEFERQHQALLQGREVQAIEGTDPLYDEIAAVFEKLTIDYPATKNGSKFLNCRFILKPQLNIRLCDFQNHYAHQASDNIFLNPTGLTLAIKPIHNRVFGPITQNTTSLILKNIRTNASATIFPNNGQCPKLPEGNIAAIKSHVDTRYIDKTQKLMKWQNVADISFGDFFAFDHAIDVQSTGSAQTTTFSISLPELAGDIDPDGTVTLPNGTTFSLKKVIGKEPVTWVSQTHIEELVIDVALEN